MCTHESKACPRCGEKFACMPGNITQCQCYGITLDEKARKFVDARYEDCLCRKCLEYLQEERNRILHSRL